MIQHQEIFLFHFSINENTKIISIILILTNSKNTNLQLFTDIKVYYFIWYEYDVCHSCILKNQLWLVISSQHDCIPNQAKIILDLQSYCHHISVVHDLCFSNVCNIFWLECQYFMDGSKPPELRFNQHTWLTCQICISCLWWATPCTYHVSFNWWVEKDVTPGS